MSDKSSVEREEVIPKPTKPRRPGVFAGWLCVAVGTALMAYSNDFHTLFFPVFAAGAVLGIIAMSKQRIFSGLLIFLMCTAWPGTAIYHVFVIPQSNAIVDQINDYLGIPTASERVQEGTKIKIGDVYEAPRFDVWVSSVNQQHSVGGLLIHKETATHDATFVRVVWNYRNNTKGPLLPLFKPIILVEDAEGRQYGYSIPATQIVSRSALKGDSFDTINPGITVTKTTIFEVPKEQFKEPGWKIVLLADERVELHKDSETKKWDTLFNLNFKSGSKGPH